MANSNLKVKYYRNADRNVKEPFYRSQPQYQALGAQPTQFGEAANVISNNLNLSRIKQESPRYGTYQVGLQDNALDDSFDVEFDESNDQTPMIDNNDYVVIETKSNPIKPKNLPTIEAPRFKQQAPTQVLSNPPKASPRVQTTVQVQRDETIEILKELKTDEYLLIANGEVLCSGPLEEIEEQAKNIYFDEKSNMEINDLIILKRISIKVGLFLGE
jgi:hypothetical protein